MHVQRIFWYNSLPSSGDHDVELPNFTFREEREQREHKAMIFFSCSELGYSPLERNSRKKLEKMRKLSYLPKSWRCFNFITIPRSI